MSDQPGFLAKDCEKCTLCLVGKTLLKPKGSPKPKVLIVGGAPTGDDNATGVPFSGRLGKLLDELLAAAGIKQADVGFTNVLRCWPAEGSARRQKTIPPPDVSVKQCSPYLVEEIAYKRPEVIVCMGPLPAKVLLGLEDQAYKKAQGQWHEYAVTPESKIPVMVVADPAGINRGSTRTALVTGLQLVRAMYDKTPVADALVNYKAVTKVADLEQLVNGLLDSWQRGSLEHGAIAVDLETMGLYQFDPTKNIVSIQIAWGSGRAALIPVYHVSVPQDGLVEWTTAVRGQMARLLTSGIPVTGHNFAFDYKWLYAKFGFQVKNVVFDSQLAAHALTGDGTMTSLAYVSAKYLQFSAYKANMKKSMGQMESVDLDLLTEYGCRDADATLRLYPLMMAELKKVGRYHTFVRLYLRTWRTLAHMEIDGAHFSPRRMEELDPVYRERLAEARKVLRSLPEHDSWSKANKKANPKRVRRGKVQEHEPEFLYPELNPNAPLQVKDFFYKHLGCSKIDSSGKVNDSTGEDRLIELAQAAYQRSATDPVYVAARAVLQARHATTKLSRYVRKLVDETQNTGTPSTFPTRIYEPKLLPWTAHAHYNLALVATGRLSSSDPNMQNIPRGSDIRSAFRSRFKYGTIFKGDFSQMELRVLAALSGDDQLIAVLSGNDPRFVEFAGDVHLFTAAKILHKDKSLVTKEERHRAKAVSFGIIYGRGANAIAMEYGISKDEAQALIDSYFELFPGVAKFVRKMHKTVREKGEVISPMGRVYPLPDGLLSRRANLSRDEWFNLAAAERQSVNYPIQGSASDVGLVSLCDIRRQLTSGKYRTRPFAFVHDSIECDLNTPELFDVYRILRDTMLGDHGVGFEWLTTSLKVEFEWGADWQGTMVCELDGHNISLSGNRAHYDNLRKCIEPWFTIEKEEVKSEGVKNDRTKSGPALKTEDIEEQADYEKVKVKLVLREKVSGDGSSGSGSGERQVGNAVSASGLRT